MGIYTRSLLVVTLMIMAAGGLYGAWSVILPLSQFHARLSRLMSLSLLEWVSLLIGLMFIQGLFEHAVGTPMISWDALTSWDKWAVDAGARHSLGRYAMGGYPQFLPCLGSIFYKLAQSSADVFPIEHLLLHGFYIQFVAILILSLLALGRTLNVPGGIILCLFVGNRLIMDMMTGQIGSVDIPFTALLCFACALCAAYSNGSWGPVRRGWHDSAVLFLPLFSVPFMKANGLIWVAVLSGGTCIALCKWREMRPVLAAVVATLALSVPYVVHQVWYGSLHWNSTEQDPFLRSHTFVLAHTKEFVVSRATLWNWIERVGVAYGVTLEYGGVLLIAGCFALCVWATRDRRLRLFAIAGPLALAIWVLTASYDFRNAAAPLAMSLIAVTGILWNGDGSKCTGVLRCVTRVGLICVALWCFKNVLWMSSLSMPTGKSTVYMDKRSAATSIFTVPFKKPIVPMIAALPRHRRHMGVRPWGDIRELLFNAPFGKRATHVLAADGLYRVLAPKGVYMMHKNRYNDQKRFDVALGEPYLKPPEQYEKVSRLRRVCPYNGAVRIFKPEFQNVSMRVVGLGDEDLGGMVLKSGETHTIQFEPLPGDSSKLKEGVLSLRLSPPCARVTLSLCEADVARDPGSAYLESVREGDYVRLLYWMNDDRSDLPQFVVHVESNDVCIVSTEWGQ